MSPGLARQISEAERPCLCALGTLHPRPHQDALIHVAVIVLDADSDDATVLTLLVVGGGQASGRDGRH